MNFLAHLFLSCQNDHLMVGNFIADSLPNREVASYPESIQLGITLHRKIDSFTDNHPSVLKSRRKLYARHSKYASVILDVFYDYLLIKNWKKYSNKKLEVFTSEVYSILEKERKWMPENIRNRLHLMIADNWLMSYGTIEGLDFVFERLKRRVSKSELINKPTETLLENIDFLNNDFNSFFPDILKYVEEECRC